MSLTCRSLALLAHFATYKQASKHTSDPTNAASSDLSTIPHDFGMSIDASTFAAIGVSVLSLARAVFTAVVVAIVWQ